MVSKVGDDDDLVGLSIITVHEGPSSSRFLDAYLIRVLIEGKSCGD
ncbi:hypothetical protein F383_11177 [Gossypium arboreum]|uniref:Uncharacterized protein n=1 Tax=Gossypium arboreum TaxID=29729 RepID=A0A0B0PZW3_GOSAR|nr:hypothetical protein F383_31577 [Gossypium arboreum]KHG29026.1 hypothetical protein F383_11177 [Gossypium arboreum]